VRLCFGAEYRFSFAPEKSNLSKHEFLIVATMGRECEENAVLNCYKSIFSRHVDLVGDYAGSEIFLQCFSNPKLNFGSKY
jgi:hypothetical protein